MSELTDADKASFIDKMIATLKQNQTELTAKDWNPSQRITNLENGEKAVTDAGGMITQLEVALRQAYENRRNLLEANYALASASVGGLESSLGKDHALLREVRGSRGAMHRPASAETAVAAA